MDGLITIAVLTGASGLTYVSSRQVSDLSNSNFIKDSKARMLEKNKSGVSP